MALNPSDPRVQLLGKLLEQHPENYKFLMDASWKQSVRTTFKLSPEAYAAKDWLSSHWSITHKELVHNICVNLFDLDDLREQFGPVETSEPVRKTQLITEGARQILERFAEEHERSRDEVLNDLLVLLREREEQKLTELHENYEKAIEIVKTAEESLQSASDQLEKLLGSKDPVVSRFDLNLLNCDNLKSGISRNLRDGTPIHPTDITR